MNWDPRALEVLEHLRTAGHQAVLVGGCVRDQLLSIPPHDYDAATSARPEEMKRACANFHLVETGWKHGTVTVFSGGLPVEVTTFRRESIYSDHRHPDQVEFTCDLTQDLARRDFTINAMAWEPGGVVDQFGGQEDLKHRLIRCVGDPDRRFDEDTLRLLRGLRLAAQLEFSIHPDTAAAIRRHAPDLAYVTWERIQAEFLRLLCSPGAGQILLDFPEVIVQILPELAPAVGFEQHTPYHIHDVYTHSVRTLEGVPPIPALRLAALLHDAGKPTTFTLDDTGVGHFYGHPKVSAALADEALTRLRLDRATRERVVLLITHHDLPVEPSESWAGRWLSRLGEDIFFDLLALKRGDALAAAPRENVRLDLLVQAETLARKLLSRSPCLTLKDLAVNGQDALAAGLNGPAIGKTLSGLLDRVARGELPNQRAILLTELALARPD